MIIAIKVKLIRGISIEDDWSAIIQIEETSTLEELHLAIQQAVGFDDDHLYCFFESRAHRGGVRKYYDDENGGIYVVTVKSLFPLPEKKSLFYLFDWGDEWVFKISMVRKRPHPPEAGISYPRVESETGTRPVQYPSAEDFYDEDEDNDTAEGSSDPEDRGDRG